MTYDLFRHLLAVLWATVLATLAIYGCTTPQHWSADTHIEMLGACRGACGHDRVASYDPMSGECRCVIPKGFE